MGSLNGIYIDNSSSLDSPVPPTATIPNPPTATASNMAWEFMAEAFGLTMDGGKSTWILVLLFSFVYQWIRKAVTSCQDLIERNVWCRVFIRNDEEIYDQWLVWMANQPFSKSARSFVVASRNTTLESFLRDDDDNDDFDDGYQRYYANRRRRPLAFTPADGWHYFDYKGKRIFLHRSTDDRRDLLGGLNEVIQLCCFGRDPNVLKDLLEEARSSYLARDHSKTVIYRDGGAIGGNGWKRCYARDSRPLSTVVLDEDQKQAFIDDIGDYLDPRTRRFYNERGIPYRRGYMLYGPPGTGKSSLSFAAAGKFNMKIYVLSLASKTLSEERLATLFSSLPSRCIILLEDIDSAGINRAQNSSTKNASSPAANATGRNGQPAPEAPNSDGNGISLSGLLNAIDGVASQENRILIMTTNHIEKLDPALIRPGRVDMKIEFKLTNKCAMEDLFCRMFQIEATSDEEKNQHVLKVKEFASQFSDKVPENTFSPAEVQGYLLMNKRRPEKAVEGVEAWIQATLVEKKKIQEAKDAAEKPANSARKGFKPW